MIAVRPSNERGHADHGWLNTYHTFSFADYYDPRFMNFRALRVINEDVVAPGQGFGMHPHQNMEIITYVLSGTLEHKDSLGNVGQIKPGDVQRMSAGRGVLHSEYNASKTEPVHLLQIWIMPEENGIKPSYEQKAFSKEERTGKLRLVASPEAEDGSVKINQDAKLFVSVLKPGQSVSYDLPKERNDGAAARDEKKVTIANEGSEEAEVLLFDLA
jgi:hypothetical protein